MPRHLESDAYWRDITAYNAVVEGHAKVVSRVLLGSGYRQATADWDSKRGDLRTRWQWAQYQVLGFTIINSIRSLSILQAGGDPEKPGSIQYDYDRLSKRLTVSEIPPPRIYDSFDSDGGTVTRSGTPLDHDILYAELKYGAGVLVGDPSGSWNQNT